MLAFLIGLRHSTIGYLYSIFPSVVFPFCAPAISDFSSLCLISASRPDLFQYVQFRMSSLRASMQREGDEESNWPTIPQILSYFVDDKIIKRLV